LAEASLSRTFAYAAPIAGSGFLYIPMWSILPGIYGKYFGLTLTSIAAVVLFVRLFDGVIDTAIGYLSDRHRASGGSRKSWVLVGGIGSIAACAFLFAPPSPVTAGYYLVWSFAYFFAFTLAEIPHLAWGSELTMDYNRRARIFGVRNIMFRVGMCAFYVLPLLPGNPSNDYTPQVLRKAVYVGGVMTALGLAWTLSAAPAGIVLKSDRDDSLRFFAECLVRNKPLLLYCIAFGCEALCYGMYFALLFFYLDSYLSLGGKIALMLLSATIVAALSTPLWLYIIRSTSKATAWAIGMTLFTAQLIGAAFIPPGSPWWIPCLLVITANLCFCCHDVAALSILGDIVDYGKLKFHKDRGATYFAISTLIFKVGLGIGGAVSLGIAGSFGFVPSRAAQDAQAVLGLKLGFILIPTCMALVTLFLISRTPLDPRRHDIVRRRLLSAAKERL
jgi:glycoside/pentoside/hexuronide:cation symporter, GPH family